MRRRQGDRSAAGGKEKGVVAIQTQITLDAI